MERDFCPPRQLRCGSGVFQFRPLSKRSLSDLRAGGASLSRSSTFSMSGKWRPADESATRRSETLLNLLRLPSDSNISRQSNGQPPSPSVASTWFSDTGDKGSIIDGKVGLPELVVTDKLTSPAMEASSSTSDSFVDNLRQSSDCLKISPSCEGSDSHRSAVTMRTDLDNSSPNYDSETLRRSAARHREASRRLFMQMQQRKWTPTESVGASPRASLSTNYSDTTSGSDSSGVGTLRSSVFAAEAAPPEAAALADSPRTVAGCRVASARVGVATGCPPTPRSVADAPSVCTAPTTAVATAMDLHRTASSAAASRGASRKISNRRKAAKEEEQRRSDLTRISADSKAGGAQERAPSRQPRTSSNEYLSLSDCESNSAASCSVARAASPIYDVPVVSTRPIEMTSPTPPPLPRKPPPPLNPASSSAMAFASSASWHRPTQQQVAPAPKPTVQVQPMSFGVARDSTAAEAPSSASSSPLTSRSSSPLRPPVPKKPTKLLVRRDNDQLSSVERHCDRLSAYLTENDAAMKHILSPSRALSPLEAFQVAVDGVKPKQTDECGGEAAFVDADCITSPSKADNIVDLESKKAELLRSLRRKCDMLGVEQENVAQEARSNDQLAESVRAALSDAGATDAQLAKLHAHMQEVGQMTRLVLLLANQLQRVDCGLAELAGGDTKERAALSERRTRLVERAADAASLRVGVKRREEALVALLSTLLPSETVLDFQYVLQTKAKLIVDQNEIEEKLRMGQEQVRALELNMDCAT